MLFFERIILASIIEVINKYLNYEKQICKKNGRCLTMAAFLLLSDVEFFNNGSISTDIYLY